MRTLLMIVALFGASLDALAVGPNCEGVIQGTVFHPDGTVARDFRVTLYPLKIALEIVLPEKATDNAGRFRFTQVCPGMFTVVPSDERSGYPFEAHWLYLYSHEMLQVSISTAKTRADFPLHLPPRPSFLALEVVDAFTNEAINNYTVKIRRERAVADETIPRTSFSTPEILAIPAYQQFSLTVTADGYKRWRMKSGKGQLANIAPSATMKIQVRLEPLPAPVKPVTRR